MLPKNVYRITFWDARPDVVFAVEMNGENAEDARERFRCAGESRATILAIEPFNVAAKMQEVNAHAVAEALRADGIEVTHETELGGGCTAAVSYLPHYDIVYCDNLYPAVAVFATFDEDGHAWENPWMETEWSDGLPTVADVTARFAEYHRAALAAEAALAALSEDANVVLHHLQQTECDGPLSFFTMTSDRLVEEDGVEWANDAQRLAAALDELIDAELLSDEGVMDPFGGVYLLTLKGGNYTAVTGDDPRFRHDPQAAHGIEVTPPKRDGLASIGAYTATCECGESLVTYDSIVSLPKPFKCEKCGRVYTVEGDPLKEEDSR